MSYCETYRQYLAHSEWYIHSVMFCVIINLMTFAQCCNISYTLSILSRNAL